MLVKKSGKNGNARSMSRIYVGMITMILTIALIMVGCGKKGDLYLPEAQAGQVTSQAIKEAPDTTQDETQKKDTKKSGE